MSRTIVLELFLPFRLFKKTANLRCTTTSAQILNSHENKTKWRVALKRKTGAVAKHLLIEPWNHPTIQPSNHPTKNLKSLKNMVCCRLMPGSNKTEPWREQGNRFIGHHAEEILAWVAASLRSKRFRASLFFPL